MAYINNEFDSPEAWIINSIGFPAYLEHIAEEVAELAQASLKYARVLRGENPTPTTIYDANEHFCEEMANVACLLNVLSSSSKDIQSTMEAYYRTNKERWKKRLKEGESCSL